MEARRADITFFLKKSRSSRVSVSALAMTGTMLTTLLRRLMNSTSRGRKLRGKERKCEPEGETGEAVTYKNTMYISHVIIHISSKLCH